MSETKQIFTKILDIQEELPAILKGREMIQGQRVLYKFRGIDDLYNHVHPLFKKHRVFMTPEVLESESTEKAGGQGKVLFYEKMTIRYRIYAEDGSFVEAITKGIGMDSGDKAGNKAMSVAQKYALIQIFSIPTDDPKDPESDTHQVTTQDPGMVEELTRKLENCKQPQEVVDLYNLVDRPKGYKHLFDARYKALRNG